MLHLVIVVIARINLEQVIDGVSHLILVLRLGRVMVARSRLGARRRAALAHLGR